MSTEPLPTAALAPSAPVKKPTDTALTSLAAIMTAAVALSLCLGFSCGVPVGWFAGRKGADNDDDKKPLAKGKDIGKVILGVKKRPEDFNWQDLQDHLASKGLRTSRAQGSRGMYFEEDDDGKPLERDYVREVLDTIGPQRGFVAKDLGTPEAAKREAARIKDVDQRDVFAWSKFLFDEGASKGYLAKLKTALGE